MMSEGRTCPPQLISESELIATMDRNGIGTDATIAAHISTIQAREYAVRNAQNLFEPTKLGLALVEGYNSMGYQLNKPQLRALIEADCQRIAKGEARREDVVRKCLEDMRQCFLVCSREATKLDASMEKYFSVLGAGDGGEHRVVAEGLSKCGVCGARMDLRATASTGADSAEGRRYLYCAACVKSYTMPRGELSGHAQDCAICRFQALTVRNAETNKEHTICPKCFR
jgi:DNA topoisomerase-3